MRLPFLEKTDGSASFLRAARAGNLEKVLEFLKTNTDINTCNANGLNALHLASKEGHVSVVTELLQRGANVDAATKKGNTALHIASLAGQEEIVKVLVQHQAMVNIQSQNGFTPLYMAAQENHDNVVRFLLANNANQSLATEDGFTPLAVALQQGHDKVVAVLLENDTRGKVRLPALHIAAKKDDTKAAALLLHTDHNPDVTSKSGFTPLHIAAHYGNENIANLLIQRGADVNYVAKHQITPLHVASKWGKGNMVSLLIDKGANYEAKTRDGLTPLHCAARSGHDTVVDMLLEKGAPITSKTKNGLAPLHMASQGDHVDAARILLYHKAPVDDVTVDFLTALHVAAHCGHVRVAKLLLDRKADPNARALNGFTPLHIACKKNRIKVVELLLKHCASIEATTESGLTPLHVASFMGCMNIVIYLIQHGASADVPTVRGETPLHLAARANQTDIIRILLRNGAQVDARAREQQTALHIASRLGNSDIVVLLLQHGAAVDATTKDHYTALHIAAKEGQEEVASVLLEHGASLTSTTKKGFTPLHLAAKYGNMKVARLLLQKDAPVDAQGKNGVTPLHVAAHYDHQNVALLLLDKGASPHATAKNGYTPLHIAARKNQMDIATTLLEYGASANAESKAGFTPLHLSSQEGHTDMATLLIEHNAQAGACAKNGLTPLHLCAQEDRVNVAAILVKHGAQIDPSTKAGYTPLHVACHFGQMNMVRFLLQHGAKVESSTQLGYTPLHQAAQQGHTQIVNLLLENKAEPNAETKDGKTALSIAQRLGYISVVETLKIVTETTITTTTTTVTEEKYKVVVPETMHETFMSESEDEGGDDTMLGDQSYRYLTADEMKSLGDDSLPIDVTKDEKMDVSFISNTMAAPPVAPVDQLSPQHQKEQQYAQYTGHYPSDNVDIAKTPILAGPESLNTTLNTTIDSAMIESQIIPTQVANQLSAQVNQTQVQQTVGQSAKGQVPADQDSVPEKAAEILSGWEGVSLNSLASCLSAGTNTSGMWRDRFLVSFMVDARGGAMRGCRHSGVRVIIPPRKAAMPMRITCRYLKKDKLVHAPPLMEGEALGSRILEMGPAGAKFLGPVIIEVPHFASLRGKEREIVILRSDNGETWREHTLEATEEAVQEVLNESFDGEELKQLEDLNTNRITRILTTDFPQYFAIVTRIRQEVHAIGPEGGMVSSTVVPQVQAVFPQGALTKKIKVGLQAQPIPTDLVAKLLGNRVAVSPIVTVEPRRRKFHKPITLTIPVPQASSKGMINQYSGEAPTLRLLCSITGVFRKRSLKGGTTRAQWEDVTGSTPLTFVNDCVSFTTTVSARFWLMDCSNIPEATKMATELYREAIHVPFMAKFVVFSKRHQLEEARVRVFCMTDDREDKTLEQQELFVEVAKSRDVEVLEGKPQYLEFAGNLVPVTKSGDQLAFNFYAFRENRLPFTVRVKDQHADPIGRVAFMRQPKDGRWKKASLMSLLKPPVFQVGRGDPPQTPICNLNIALPDNIQPEPAPSEPDLLALEKKYSFLSISKADTIHKADLRLTDISNMLGTDWVGLARELEISDSDINIIKSQYPDNAPKQAIVMLRLWMQTSGNKANGNTLEKGLRKIGRDDIVNQCIFNVELVTDDIEKAMAKAHLDQSGFDAFRYELGPSRDTTLNRDVSLDVSYDEQDMMKRLKELREAESAEEEEENQRSYQDKTRREQHTADMSPTYESEEKKYAGEEKIVTEEKITKEEIRDGSAVTVTTTTTSVVTEPVTESKKEAVIKPKEEPKDEAIITEKVVQEDRKVPPAKEAEKVEDKVPKPEKGGEKPVVLDKAEEKVVEKVDEEVVEQKVEEKPVVKVVEKSTDVGEKAKDVTERLEEKAQEVPPASLDEAQKAGTTTATEIITGPDGTTTSSTTTTTERRSFTTEDDGTVKEHIVIEKKTTSFVDGLETGEDKSEILQKLGEELGRLDEQLEERFKEKRKAVEPEVAQEEVRETTVVAKRREGQAEPTSQVVVEHSHQPTSLSATITSTTTTTSITPTPDGFTQASVESRQMSSTGGTTEVSTKGTAITATEPVTGDETVMQMGQALIQQRTSRPDSRRAAHDVLQWDTPLEDSAYKKRLEDGKEQVLSDDSTKAGRTEERGCSPITVLEARAEVDHVAMRPLSRAGSHTITTTTSWGAPVTTTTSIEVDDDQSARCVQLTLHSESRVTLHAPGGVWEGLHVEQEPEHQDEEQQPQEDKNVGDNDVPAEASPDSGPVHKNEGETLREQDLDGDIYQYSAEDAHELESKVQIKKSECSLSQGADAIVSTTLEEVSSTEAPTYLIAEKIREDIVVDSSKTNEDFQLPSITGAPDVQVDLSMDEVQMPILSSIKDSISEGSIPDIGNLPSTSKISISAENIVIAHRDNTLSAESVSSDKEFGDSAEVEDAKKVMAESAQDVVEIASRPLSDEDSENVSPSYDVIETECAIPPVSGEDSAYLTSEATAPSAHRPTTLMITSNSNESTDDAECTANDLTKLGREDDIPKELKEETSVAEVEELEEQGMGELAASERPPGSESGAVPRPERPARPAPRTTTLVKVKVEKRPVGSHLLVRERSVHEHQPTAHVPSVEEEVRGLMQEVKEATSQIKQEVKELRQADTPTPDTPTPLREFKEFLNREEEQELERLPTIKEMCRESEEDASGTVGAPSMFGKRPGIESFFYKGFFLPQGTHEATQIAEHQTTTVSQEQASSGLPTPGTKAGSAHGKSKLTEADLAVLESMVIAQEAEVEEMAFAHDQAEAQAKAQEEQLQARNQGQQQKPKVKGQKKQGQAKRQQQQGKVEEQSLLDKAQGHIQQEKGKGQLKDKKGALPEIKSETQSKVGQVQQNEEGQKQPSHIESLIQPAQAQQAQSEDLAQTTQVHVESLIQPTQEKGQVQQVQVESLIQPTQEKGQTQQVQVESLIQPTQEKGQAQVQVESLIQPTQEKGQAQQVQVESLIQPTQEKGQAQVQVENLIQPTQVKGQAQQVQVESLIQPTQEKGQAQIQVKNLIQPTQVKGQAQVQVESLIQPTQEKVQLEDLSQPTSKKSQAHSQAGVKDQIQQGQAEYIIQQTQELAQQPQTGEATQGQLGLTQQLRVNGHQQQVQLGQIFIQKEGQFSQDQAQTLVQQETPSKQVQPEATTKVRQSTTRVTSPGKGHSATLASAATPVGQEKQQQQFGDLTKRVADVASTMASTLESITAVAEGLEGSHLSSDEGEEQLMLMRDSPRWEDEEIQAEDTDEPRAIKAEIKLLVKTTEVGKESIEIRSIREFVESDEKNLAGFGGVVPSPIPEAGRVTPQGDRVYTLQRSSPSARTPSPRFVRQQQSSPVSSYIQPTHDEFDLMAQVRDGVLHGGCPEAQGMDWEGKSVDSMYTETVVQARISMPPAVDTSEGVAPTFSPTTTLPCAAPQPSTSPHTDLTFQTHDLTQQPPYSHLNLEPSHLHESHLVEPQSFDISPSSVTKLSDPLFLEKGFTSAAEGLSKLVTSPSAASLQSESVAPFTGTDDMAAASVTYNTSSAVLSIGPVSPTEDSSEDHAEIDRTSTELSPDSVRFEQDMLETRTEDEAPDLDDDMMAGSPMLGPELSERVFSVEATEDTDITTPMEMRDSHTERDATASNLESVDDKEGTEGKSDLKDQCWDNEDNITCLAQETAEIHSRVIKLQEKVKAQEVDLTTAKSEAELILNTVADIREAVSNGKGESDVQKSKMAQNILENISSISDTVAKIIQNLNPSDVETSSLLMKGETGVTKTESTVKETGSPEEGSPSDSNIRDQTFSDLLDSDDINRESLEDEFEKLAAEMSLSPKAEEALVHKPEATITTVPSDAITYPVSSSIIYPSKTPDALQATQREPDVGVVFTERKEYGGGVKPSAETTGGHSHISPSPVPHPSQSSSLTTDQKKVPSTKPVSQEEGQRPTDESTTPSRPTRRHERTFSQASNIYTGAIPTEPKQEGKKGEKETIPEEADGVSESIKPYSERKQFWESVTGQSFEAKGTQLIKTETESDTDTTGTDGTVVEQQIPEKKPSVGESSDSETEYLAHREKPAFYENQAFIGTEKIDVPKEEERDGAVSPFEVRRRMESQDLPSPEDIAFKDVSSKRALFEKEIKRQSMEIEESQSWKRSSKEYDETVVISEESASSTLQKKEERKQTLEETVQSEKDLSKIKKETREDIVSKTDVEKVESEQKKDKVSKKDDVSEITESSKLLKEKMQVKEKKSLSEVSTGDSKVVTQTDLLSEKKEKESTEKAGKVSMVDKKIVSQTDISKEKIEKEIVEKAEEVIHESRENESGILSRTVSKSEEKAESLSEARETIQTRSTEDQDTSRDEITEEDMTRTEETSEEEADELMTKEKVTVNVTEETRQLGDTHETVVRETTTTRDGEQEQRIIKETKTQQTVMADGSTVKTTSITTFTTQLDTKEAEDFPDTSKIKKEIFEVMTDEPAASIPEEKDVYKTMTAKEKSEAFVEQRMKSDIFSQELSSSAEDQSPEHKVITPKETGAPVSLQAESAEHPLTSPIRVPEESVQEIVWEVSQERSETVLSETVEDIPSHQPIESHQVKEISREEQKKPAKPRRKSSGSTEGKLSEEEARKLAIEIVEEVKMEAVKRSPIAPTAEGLGESDGATQPPFPRPSPESAFTEETTTKIEKYIQEQLGDEVDEKQLKLIESVTARKTEMLQKKMIGSEYQHSMEITDEDLRSSGAELSPIEHQMERLRQMTEEDDTQRYAREPSEADESESSIIIHETADDIMSSEYDQANQMITKTLDALKTAELAKVDRPIETIKEVPETTVHTAVTETKDVTVGEKTDFAKLSKLEVTETARQLVKEVTEKAQESEAVRQASLTAAELRQASGSREHSRTPSPKPGSRKGSWMDDEDLRREFRRDYEDKKKMFKEEMTTDKDVFEEGSVKESKEVKVSQQKSSDREVHMESSMTESMEESSTVESVRSIEGKIKAEVITSVVKEVKEVETEKKEEVVMRKKGHVEEFNRRSGTDFDTYSSSGESHYFTAAEGTSDSRAGSRPCSSDVEALISERTTGTSEYDTALTSQDASQYSSYSTSSQDYRTAASSISSRDSMKSIDSESSGHLASFELSEASETLVPSAAELEKDMDLLDQDVADEEASHSHHPIIPQLTIQSDTPKSEDAPGSFEVESDDAEFEQDSKDTDSYTSKMKRSIEMTFYPEPKPLSSDKKGSVTESVASSLEESTVSEVSMATVVEQDKSMQGSTTTDSNMTASSVSEQMMSSVEGQDFDHQVTCTDSGVLTTDTGDGDMTLHSVTITATSVPPSTDDQSTASMCTQVTSETRAQVELTESEQFFRANGPTEVDYVPEYDDEEVQGARPAVAPTVPAFQEAAGAIAGPSEGPQKVVIVEECYETEADQEYGQMMRESEYSELAEAELQYSLEEQPEAEMSSMLVIEEPIERPRTPEPGYIPSPRPTSMIIQSPEEPEEFTEVDKRFSAVFSTTYEERDEGSRSSVSDVMSIDVPDITVTEHTLPMPSQYCYPDLEREEDFPECRALAEAEDRGPDIPATPGSQESASTCASRKSSSTDSEQGREYCLDDMAQGPSFGSFEMVEADEIDDFSEYERTLYMHEERMMEMTQIKEEDEEEVEEERRLSSSPIPIPTQLKAVKIDNSNTPSESQASDETEDPEETGDPTIEEQRRWLELQFEESDAANYEYQQTGFIEHVYSGPLEDIEEEREDAERRDLSHITKNSSLSSTPEYDVLAGRKFFTRSGEHDDVSMTSLQEFENLEQQVAVEAIARRASSGSQESLNGKRPESKSGHGDDISVGSFASLQEFERLEKECLIVEQIEKKAQEEAAMLSEIEEGHESQMSESESCETLSEPGRASVEGEEYDQRLFEIDEIIRQAQDNVEKFDKTKAEYEGVRLQDIVSVDGSGSGSSHADRTPSVGREEGDADSLEEAQLPELDLDQTGVTSLGSSAKQDTMSMSADSIEAAPKHKVPRETSQDSLEKADARSSDPMTTSVDSIEFVCRQDLMTTSTDSIEARRRRPDAMSASTDSIEPSRRDIMATSIDSLGRDDSSGRDADISSGSEQVRPLPRDGGVMECSLESLEPTSSQATHATYQYDTDSIMSGSFTSGCSNTLVASTDDFPDMMTSSMYIPEGELPPESEEQYIRYMQASGGTAAEIVQPTSEEGYSHTVTRVVRLPPEAKQVTFTGPDAQKKMEEYMQGFNVGEHTTQEETVDAQGNVHIRRVTQKRIVADPKETKEHGFSVADPSVEELETRDEHGNVTRIVKRTVVTTHTVEVDLDTGEPIVQPPPTTVSSPATSFSRIPRPVTSPPLASRSPPPGPPPGSRGPREPVLPSLEPNTVSGVGVDEMSSVMESYTSDGSDPITTTQTTRIIRRAEIEDGEVKEDVYEEY
ncbi:ankyrin-2-like isoform X6 [Penaeus japonicus]|uniref:ankyrin-2-like isoform X6 n=1 Tax=Penaeus japonicus TaxID=27405 RepID=UPI001C70E23B|nr:ankyrin-2-like isoform X6 [Penaeus japonicus]